MSPIILACLRLHITLYVSQFNADPKKRPQSSSVPTIISKGDNVMLVAGASGGSHIVSATLQTILHVIERGMSAQDAVNHPRMHHQLIPNSVFLEANSSRETNEFLKSKGHETFLANVTVSGVSIVSNENGILVPAGDPRKGGAGSVFEMRNF
jgi:gamma-glutamyltranspeptidase